MQTKRVLLALWGALLGVALSFTGCQQQEEAVTAQQSGKYELNFTPAKTNSELEALRKDPNANLIRTLAQFDALVADRLTPLSKLPSETLEEFRTNIVVREGIGVVSLKFGDVKKRLSPAEFNEVMALFGIDTENGFWGAASSNSARRSNTAEDYHGYSCREKGTCETFVNAICLSGC